MSKVDSKSPFHVCLIWMMFQLLMKKNQFTIFCVFSYNLNFVLVATNNEIPKQEKSWALSHQLSTYKLGIDQTHQAFVSCHNYWFVVIFGQYPSKNGCLVRISCPANEKPTILVWLFGIDYEAHLLSLSLFSTSQSRRASFCVFYVLLCSL